MACKSHINASPRSAAAPRRSVVLSRRRERALPAEPAGRDQYKFEEFLDGYTDHPGRSLTLPKLMRAYDEAEEGYPRTQCQIFEDRIEADSHLRSQLELRRDSVAQKGWEIVAGGPTEADKEAAELLAAAIAKVPDFEASLEHQAEFSWYGWSGTEIIWRRRADGLAVPVEVDPAPHERFLFNRRGEFLLDVSGVVGGQRLRPGSWWITRRPGRRVVRSGLMRTAAFAAVLKAMSLSDWMIYADRFGLPYVTGEYGTDFPDEEKPKLKKALQNIGTDGWAMFHNAAKIVINESRGGGGAESIHATLCHYLDSQISKLISGGVLQSDTGSGQGSASWALAKVHQSGQFGNVRNDASKIQSSFRTDVGRPFVHFNGLDAAPPSLILHVEPEMTPAGWAELFKLGQEIGLSIDEDQARRVTKIRAPSTPERALSPPAPAPPAGAGPGNAEPEEEQKDDE